MSDIFLLIMMISGDDMGRPKFIDNQIKQRIGTIRKNKDGEAAVCLSYKDCDHITVNFIDYNYIHEMRWDHFNDGKFDLPKEIVAQNRKGQIRIDSNGNTGKCIEYYDCNNLTVIINNNIIIKNMLWRDFNNGKFHLNKFNGYIGICPKQENGSNIKEYETWMSMLKRCYSESVQNNRPTYAKCEVCPEWMTYDNFYYWIIRQENYNQWKNTNSKWCLDKDLLIKGNKIYSPETCLLVPNNINCIILKCDGMRGKYPIGVYLDKTIGLFRAQCENPKYGKQISLGYYEDPESAFKAYKIYKEKLIKQIATEEYQNGNITERCYNAMMNYEVEITD